MSPVFYPKPKEETTGCRKTVINGRCLHKTAYVGHRKHYKVTAVIYTTAENARQAAHIAKGLLQSKDELVSRFTVEESSISYGAPVRVNLSKKKGEEGYIESASGF